MDCNELLSEARVICRTIEAWPLDAPGLGEALTAVTHACEQRETERARLVIAQAQQAAHILGGKGER